ncbi:MAG: hypothetical protein AAGA37_21005 [Actinomycetota bacterium]
MPPHRRQHDRGATAMETAIMVGLIALVAAAGLSGVGRSAGGEDIETANEALGEEAVEISQGSEASVTADGTSLTAATGAGGSSGALGYASEGVSNTGLGGVFGGENIAGDHWNTHWPGDTIGDWEVLAGSVDVHADESHRFNFDVEGEYIDLNGYGAGHIRRTIDVIPDAYYNLSVDISENPGGPAVKQMEIIWNGEVVSTLHIDVPRGEIETFTVQLPKTVSGEGVLEFKSLLPSNHGPVIDNPTLTFIPNRDD